MKRERFTRISSEEMERQAGYMAQVARLHKSGQRYFVRTFGCQLNDHDSEVLSAQLEQMGYVRAESAEEADLYILNTCSIRENADQRFFGNLGQAKQWVRENPERITVVCGCMMKVDEHVDHIRKTFPYVDMIFGPQDIYRFPELLYRRLCGSRRVYDIGDQDVIAEGLPVVHERKYRALCTIMYGCNNFCTYCIVPYTRGRERSRDADQILAELKELETQNFSEVMLLGQNVNSYRGIHDAQGQADPESFALLLERICQETRIPRIRFMTSHPKDISRRLLEVMARYPQIERHLHLPLQSGSDRILDKMNRHYTLEHYRETLRYARELMPELALSTDLIVAFPGETEEDFAQTLEAVREFAYDSAFTFIYSPRVGTPAALLAEQIDADVAAERFKRLIELQNANSLAANQRRVGRRDELLIEGLSEHSSSRFTGRGSDFHLVNFEIPQELRQSQGWDQLSPAELGQLLEGCFCEVEILEAKTFSLLGRMTAFHGKRSRVFDALGQERGGIQ